MPKNQPAAKNTNAFTNPDVRVEFEGTYKHWNYDFAIFVYVPDGVTHASDVARMWAEELIGSDNLAHMILCTHFCKRRGCYVLNGGHAR